MTKKLTKLEACVHFMNGGSIRLANSQLRFKNNNNCDPMMVILLIESIDGWVVDGDGKST